MAAVGIGLVWWLVSSCLVRTGDWCNSISIFVTSVSTSRTVWLLQGYCKCFFFWSSSLILMVSVVFSMAVSRHAGWFLYYYFVSALLAIGYRYFWFSWPLVSDYFLHIFPVTCVAIAFFYCQLSPSVSWFRSIFWFAYGEFWWCVVEGWDWLSRSPCHSVAAEAYLPLSRSSFLFKTGKPVP